MKYLAILKDSFREALDTKVLYVMVGLSLLVILFVASMSFTPAPAEDLMSKLIGGHVVGFDDLGRQGSFGERRESRPGPGVQRQQYLGVEPLKGEADSPDSEYLITFKLLFPDEATTKKFRQDPEPTLAALRKELRRFDKYGLLKITDIRLADKANKLVQKDEVGLKDAKLGARTVYFEMTTQPTESTRRLWPYEISLFFGALPIQTSAPLGFLLYFVASLVLSIGSWVTIIVSIIITAFFIPNMLRKGTVDLLLVKPIHRWTLLVYKFIGGLTFIFLNTAVAVTGIWLVLGLRSGVWANSFLLTILIITFFFAILYAVSTLFGVLTRSAIVAILVTCGVWFLFYVVGTLYQVFDDRQKYEENYKVAEEERWSDSPFGSVVRGVHYVLPRTSDLNRLMNKIIMSDFLTGDLSKASQVDTTSITWGESLTVSLIFIGLMLGISSWWFTTKDY
jgi:ABC-type transport system involved in multi-copper enzyme maturation permease subunit